MIGAAYWLSLVLVADPTLALDASVRDEIRTGTAVALGGGTSAAGLEEVLIPAAQGSWRTGEHRFTLRYDPELLIPDLGQGNHLQALHRGELDYIWNSHTRSESLVLTEQIEYGIIDLFGLTPTSTTANPTAPQLAPQLPLQPIPTVIGINYESSNSLADFRWAPSRRTTLDVGGGYRLNGGADAAAQASFPLEQGPFVVGSLLYAASRRDTLTSRLSATEVGFSSGPTDVLLEADQEASRRLVDHLLGTVGLGVGAVRYQATSKTSGAYDGYPEATASLVETLPTSSDRTLTAAVTATVAPLIDRLGGTIFESFQVLGRLEWTSPSGISLRAMAGYNDPLYGNLVAAEQLELVQGSLSYQPARFLRLEAGGLGTWQQPASGALATTQWLAFAALVLQETVQK
jgi:hypothetical protein